MSSKDSDTDVSILDLNLLENLNTNQSLNYIKLEQKLDTIGKDITIMEELNNEFRRYIAYVDDIGKQVEKMEAIVEELDCWTLEALESMSKK